MGNLRRLKFDRWWPWPAFALTAGASLAAGALDLAWTGWRPATCMPEACFCEALRQGAVAQPVNAYSNLAFVLVGLLILGEAARAKPAPDVSNPMRSRPAFPAVFGAAVVAIGLGSLFYHASMSFAGQWFDVMGMYLLATFLVLYNLARLRPMSGGAFARAYIAANALLGVLLIVAPEARRQVFAGLIVAAIALEIAVAVLHRPRIRAAWFAAALACFALAYAIWILDDARILCAPESLLQGHAAWHALSAAAAGLVYLYYRSETRAGAEGVPVQ